MTREDRLTTCGEWNLEAFLASFAGQAATLLLCRVWHDGGGMLPEIGTTVRRIWDHLRETFPPAQGHRLSWGDLAFLVPEPDPAASVAKVSVVAQPLAGSPCKVDVALLAAPLGSQERRSLLDEVGWRLAKIDYRKEYPDAWCIRDGTLVHRPG